MITKEFSSNQTCLFCASDYHLEMILLPYINKKINNSNFIIVSQTNLTLSIEKLLNRINIDKKVKKKIKNLNWNKTAITELDNIFINLKDYKTIRNFNYSYNIIINGDFNYITKIHNYLKENISEDMKIIDCYHIDDKNIDITTLSEKYHSILNTDKIE